MNTLLFPGFPAAEAPNLTLFERRLPPAGEPARPVEAPAALHPAEAVPDDIGLAEAARLLEQGRVEAAQQLLRTLPHRGQCRAEAVGLTLAAAGYDPEFHELIGQADLARDEQRWGEAEYLYWRALALYPLHAGYLVQYGHALKEQGKLADAEVAYRSALALGETAEDLGRHIAHVAATLGHVAPRPEPRHLAAAPPPVLPLDEAPCRADVELAFALVLHRPPQLVEEVLPLLRSAPTRRAMLLALLARPEVATANRDLLLLLAQTA